MIDFFTTIFRGEYVIITYLLAVLLIFAVSVIMLIVISKIAGAWAGQEAREFVSRLRVKLRLPVILLALFVSLVIPISFFDHQIRHTGYISHLISVMVIIFVSCILIQSVHLIKFFILRKFDIQDKDNLQARKVFTQFRVLENIVIFLIVLVGVSLVLMSFEGIRKIGVSLIASAGVAGIIIGFAAQRAIGTILAGIQIALSQPIRLDDVVIVENEWGRIEEINLTYVVVAIWDKRRLVLPTTYFIEKPFQNWTRTDADILGTVFIYADYTLPVDAVRKELDRILEGNPLWDGKVKVVQVTDATERTVELRALVSAADSPSAWDLRVYVRERLLAFLQEKYPHCLPRARVSLDPGRLGKDPATG